MRLSVGASTDKGLVRQNNEDNFYVSEEAGLFLVADGMGGHASGEVASKIAVEVVRDFFDAVKAGKHLQLGTYRDEFSEAANQLASAMRLANQAIYEAAKGNPAWQGMGTTMAAVIVNKRRLAIAHVGDSRVYLVRSGSIEQLTDDHTLVSEQVKRDLISREEAKQSEMKNVLTRAVGVGPEVEVDLDELSLLEGDSLLLCSDGLTTMIDEDQMMAVVATSDDPKSACERLIALANENGGRDNITVVVAHLLKKKGFLAFLSSLLERFRR